MSILAIGVFLLVLSLKNDEVYCSKKHKSASE